MIKYSLGIDISMKIFHACLSVIDTQQQVKIKATRKFDNNASGFKELQYWIQKHYKQQGYSFTYYHGSNGCLL